VNDSTGTNTSIRNCIVIKKDAQGV